jgi:lipid-binding SYLF domain-containing protein
MGRLFQRKSLVTGSIFLLLLSVTNSAAQSKDKRSKRIEEAVNMTKIAAGIIDKVAGSQDKPIPKDIFYNAEAVGVFSTTQEGLVISGLIAGKGVVCRRTADGWGAPVFLEIGGGSAGPQIGLKESGIILFFMNDRAVDWLLEKSLVLQGEKKAIPGPAGAMTNTSTANIYSYSFGKGKFAGLEYKKLAIFPDNNLNEAVYAVKAHDILKSSDHGAPPNIPNDFNKLLEALTRAFSRE